MPGIASAIGGFLGSIFGGSVGTFLTKTFFGRLLTTIALTALQIALAPKPKLQNQNAGIVSDYTSSGGVTPESFILGLYATGGQMICPPLSHGNAGGVQNAYLTYVIALCGKGGATLEGLICNGEEVPLDGTVHATYGQGVTGKYANKLWVKYHDGSQTTADSYLLGTYGSHPDFPWDTAMIGRDLCYAIVTFKFDTDIYSGLPVVRFIMRGIPLYDPRKDTTVGGSGTHRWTDTTTWEQTDNVEVMKYNILRGITFIDGSKWGGRVEEADLPLSNWFTAMNACDALVPLSAGGSEPAYRAGYEVYVDQAPATIIAELGKTNSSEVVESGGYWRSRVGPPSTPIYTFTDEDVNISESASFDPFPRLDDVYNGIHASYPDPAQLWEQKDAPPRYNATYETEDNDRRLVANLQLPACPYPNQVQRLMQAYITEERRFRRHGLSLPPEAAIVECLDSVSWTSVRNGYTNKVFEVAQMSINYLTMNVAVLLREKDSADYAWSTVDQLPTSPVPPPVVTVPVVDIQGYSVTGHTLEDDTAAARKAAILVSWSTTDIEGIVWLETQIRLKATSQYVVTSALSRADAGSEIFSNGILPNMIYQVRSKFIIGNTANWTVWTDVTTPDVRISTSDLDDIVNNHLTGLLDISRFAQTIRPVEIVATLPTTGNFEGRLALLTTDGKTYRYYGGAWIKTIDGNDLIANSVIAGKIAAGAISTTELAAGAVTAGKIAVSDQSRLFSDSFDYTNIAADWVVNSGTGELSIVTDVNAIRGGKALQAGNNSGNDTVNMRSRRLIPFDPNKMYRLTARAVRIAGSGLLYVGWQGFAADGTTLVDANGGTTLGVLQYWHCVFNAVPGSGGAYVEYEGYTKGYGASTGTNNVGTRTSPGKMHPNVRFIAPAFILVAGNVSGITRVDYFDIDEVSAGVLIEPAGITAEHVAANSIQASHIAAGAVTSTKLETGVLSVQQMAAFGGSLESLNYSAGVSGWAIDENGNAEFNELIVRQANIENGAVTDKTTSSTTIVTVTRDTQSYALDPTTVGAVEPNELRFVGWGGFTSKVSTYSGIVTVQRRKKITSTLWAAWEDVYTSPSVQALSVGSYSFGGGEFLSGKYYDVEYRFKTNMTGTSIPSSSASVVSDLSFTISNIVK